MAEKKVKWVDTCERFVAFLDIMGFRDRVYRDKHEEVGGILEALHPTVEEIEKTASMILAESSITLRKGFKEILESGLIRPISFSDSIVLVSNNDSDLSAIMIVYYVNLLLSEAINKKVPLKGAIAFGKQTADFNKSIHFGRPLIDAFELQKEVLLYGIILHHTIEKRLIDLDVINKFYIGEVLFKYPIPMKSGKISHYLTDWTKNLDKKVNSIELVSKLYSGVSGKPRIYVDNTIEFIREMQKRQSELEAKKKSPRGSASARGAEPL